MNWLADHIWAFLAGLPPGYVAGLFSKYASHKLAERSERLKSLSDKAYRPLHEQLYRARPAIQNQSRIVDRYVWSDVQAAGLDGRIPRRLRQDIEALYTIDLPTYDRAWMEATGRMGGLLDEWDRRFGVRPTGGSRVLGFDWWPFLSADDFHLPLPDLGLNEFIPLHAEHIGRARLVGLGQTLEAFLRDRWDEAHGDPAFVRFGESREQVLRTIPQLLKRLKARIRP